MRIYIVGPGWSGKSTLAKKLSDHYNIPVVHLDRLLWKEWWIANDDYRTLQAEAIAQNDWIIEWDSCSILKLMQHRVDLVVLLNHSPLGNVGRIIKRFLKWLFLKEKRIGLAIKNANRLHFGFLRTTAKWRTRQLPRIRANIAEYSLEDKVIEIKSLKNVFETVVFKIENII